MSPKKKEMKVTAVLVKYGEKTVEGDIYVKGCFDNSIKQPHTWDVKKNKSKAGDNAEIVKLKFKIKKIKEVLSDAHEALLCVPYDEQGPEYKPLMKRIHKELHR